VENVLALTIRENVNEVQKNILVTPPIIVEVNRSTRSFLYKLSMDKNNLLNFL